MPNRIFTELLTHMKIFFFFFLFSFLLHLNLSRIYMYFYFSKFNGNYLIVVFSDLCFSINKRLIHYGKCLPILFSHIAVMNCKFLNNSECTQNTESSHLKNIFKLFKFKFEVDGQEPASSFSSMLINSKDDC